MELPASLYGSVAEEGNIYFFAEGCPKGIANHPHILVRHNGTYLFLTTCSSQLTTALRLAQIRKWDERTYPVVKKSSTNNLDKDSYVNCNDFVEMTEEEFGDLTRRGLIRHTTISGSVSAEDLRCIRLGIELSINISDEDKDRILH